MSRLPQIMVISCRFGWGYQVKRDQIAAGVQAWEQVVCCGSIEPETLLEPLRMGVDGVLIFACPRGECHFQEGEWQCLKRVTLLQGFIDAHGINPQRLSIHFGNDPTGESIASLVKEFTERLKAL